MASAGGPQHRLPSDGNVLLMSDSYKVSHHGQLPPNTTQIYSYFESRGGLFPETVFFGLQYILKNYLVGKVVTREHVEEAREIFALHFGRDDVFNYDGWMHIVKHHHGRLPLEIRAVPEGTVVPVKNVLFTVVNTDPKVPWLTNWFEVWYPMTVCTSSREQKKILAKYMQTTAESLDSLPFKLHDFGFRGVSSLETAAIGGMAHLVNFSGTDTVGALVSARRFYGCPCAGASIPASEHSTMTAWLRDGETDAFRNMLERFGSGIFACVSDSYNIWDACKNKWGSALKDAVIAKGEKGGILVVRPDSGDPTEVVIKCLELLGHAFGTTTNSKGFKMLPKYVRLIQGDGINIVMLESILQHMLQRKWSAENIAFGSGGALLQKVNRDTQKCAFKCSYAIVDGKPRNIHKEPITDPGKKSKNGHLTLEHKDGKWTTITEGKGDPKDDQLHVVFKDGVLKHDFSFEEVRKRAQLAEIGDAEVVAGCSNPGKDGAPCGACDEAAYSAWAAEWLK